MTPATTRSATRLLALTGCLLAGALPGCALLTKSEVATPRYFSPEFDAGDAPQVLHPELALRLGRVEGWSHLRERLARSSASELYYDEGRRWAELPEVYLRRALSRALFEQRGVVEATSGRAITLEVELIAFQEVDRPRRARLEAQLLLRDDRLGLLEETISVERPIEDAGLADPAPAIVGALSEAMREGVARIADLVVARLGQHLRCPAGTDCKATPPPRREHRDWSPPRLARAEPGP